VRERYTLFIPGVPPSLNEYKRMHWGEQERRRKAFQQMVWAVLNEKGNRCPRGLERIVVRAVLTFPVDRRRDSDNYGAVLAKWVQDVLVREGVIPDDTADRCTFYPPGIITGETEHTFLVIERRD
jgi:hypothetical protein